MIRIPENIMKKNYFHGAMMQVILIRSYTDKTWRSLQTYDAIECSLREKWDVTSIHTLDVTELKTRLLELSTKFNGQIFVFNIAEYLDEEKKQGFIPAILDEMKIPHLGSNALAIEVGLDKAAAKDLFNENDVPTPASFVVEENEEFTTEEMEAIGFPLIVKPVHEGGHIGIDESSIVRDRIHLEEAIQRIWDEYQQPAIVEDYIIPKGMREFSVGIIDGKQRIFTPIEIDYEAMDVDEPILTYDLAQDDLEEICLVEEGEVRDEIILLAQQAFDAVGAEDYSRVDIRMNETGYYVLEINTMPGLGPHSFLPQAASLIYDFDYATVIQNLTSHGLQRELLDLN